MWRDKKETFADQMPKNGQEGTKKQVTVAQEAKFLLILL